ncbi:hypothetical protein SynA1825c_00848 [Synechococcus sp. A18-25c]|nr:hypothetical protein SynA1825c_00848 [Synechococcus sp. A18-25c]
MMLVSPWCFAVVNPLQRRRLTLSRDALRNRSEPTMRAFVRCAKRCVALRKKDAILKTSF